MTSIHSSLLYRKCCTVTEKILSDFQNSKERRSQQFRRWQQLLLNKIVSWIRAKSDYEVNIILIYFNWNYERPLLRITSLILLYSRIIDVGHVYHATSLTDIATSIVWDEVGSCWSAVVNMFVAVAITGSSRHGLRYGNCLWYLFCVPETRREVLMFDHLS